MFFKSKAKKRLEERNTRMIAEAQHVRNLQTAERFRNNELTQRVINKTYNEFLTCLQSSCYKGIDWHFRDGQRSQIELTITFKVFSNKIEVLLFIPSIESSIHGTNVTLAEFSFLQESYPDLSLDQADVLARILSEETCKQLETMLEILSIDGNWTINASEKYVSDFWEGDRYRRNAETYVKYLGYPKYPRRTNSW